MRTEKCCIVLTILLAMSLFNVAESREVRDSVKIYFRQGYSVLDMSIGDNRETLDRIADSLTWGNTDSV